jgi:preprotein translocase subunit SecA
MIEQAGGHKSDLTREMLLEELLADASAAYDAREEDLGAEVVRELERRVLLTVIDRKWREHLYEMDYLREGINLRAMAQRDPVVEYQREGFAMFSAMMDGIQEESVSFLFNLQVEVQAPDGSVERVAGAATPANGVSPNGSGASSDGPALDVALLAAAQDAHETAQPPAGGSPHINAKGLDRTTSAKPLVYSSPTLDSATPEVRVGEQNGSSDSGAGPAKRGPRPNPNRGSRGNRSSNARRGRR